jgi:aryl-alcohol dehydrogenase-like predicted oxidoreductase
LNYRELGRSGLRVSEIGFGTWGLGGDHEGAVAYGATDDAVSRAALERALALGINFYDTADFYGHGHSETLLGQAFGTVRQRVLYATKGGLLKDGRTQDFSPGHLRRALEASLLRLNAAQADLYQLHSPALDELRGNRILLDTLDAFRREGLVRAVGISVRAPADGLEALNLYAFDAMQVNFNLTDQRALDCGLFEQAERAGCGIIARTPLCFGFLTGAFDADSAFPPGDHRLRWSREQRQRWADSLHRFTAALLQDLPQTPAQLALRYCLSFPAVSCAIPGMLTPAQVDENAAASGLPPLSAEALDRARAIYQGSDFFSR